jgi:alginate O-acetyltransferase complex protein AlgI
LPKKAKNIFILIASILFYTWGAPKFVLVLIGSCIISFFLVRGIHKNVPKPSTKKTYLILSIALNLGVLLFYKYSNFMIENVNNLNGIFDIAGRPWHKVMLPIGISFFTFQSISYAVDV